MITKVVGTVTRYFREGPMTETKREWVQKQIDGLEQANREIAIRINSETVILNVNLRQIESLRNLLRNNTNGQHS